MSETPLWERGWNEESTKNFRPIGGGLRGDLAFRKKVAIFPGGVSVAGCKEGDPV